MHVSNRGMKSKGKVLVGMSGGIDSSAVCMLLQEQGYEVIGVTLRMWDTPSQFPDPSQQEPLPVLEARALADRLGIGHYALDVREDFRRVVVRNFIDEYLCGHTPNPCVLCNPFFKWRYLLQEADRLECARVATGHYARIVSENDLFRLTRGEDPAKDQSYFLWRLGQKELSRTLFPLGTWLKSDVKKYVWEKGFREKAAKKESMEVCFIDDDYRTFLKRQVPGLTEQVGKGWFVDEEGKKLGEHRGYPFYTIGQRKGLEIALGYPAFVTKINPAKNTITLGKKESLSVRYMILENYETAFPELLFSGNPEITVKIRYRSAGIPAVVVRLDERCLRVEFGTEASAVTPGQSAVFYHEGAVIGGGIIGDRQLLKKYKM